MPRFLAAEHAILEALGKRDANNWLGAVNNIPKNLRTMYPHAYQVFTLSLTLTLTLTLNLAPKLTETRP